MPEKPREPGFRPPRVAKHALLKKPSRPPPSRKRDFRGFLREIRLRVGLVGARMRMHEMPRIPCFSACAVRRALCLRAFTRRRSVVLVGNNGMYYFIGIVFLIPY